MACIGLSAYGQDAAKPSEQKPAQTGAAPTKPARPAAPPKYSTPYKPRCEAPRDHDEASLCEERKATEIASEANEVSRRNFWLSLGGLVALIVTIFYTARAARAADAAAEAAQASVKDAREIGEAQTRAYLSVKKFLVRMNERLIPTASMTLANSGQTPARVVSFAINVDVRPLEGQSIDIKMNKRATGDASPFPDIAANSSPEVPYFAECGPAIDWKVFAKLYVIEARVTVSYVDVFKRPHDFTVSGARSVNPQIEDGRVLVPGMDIEVTLFGSWNEGISSEQDAMRYHP